MFCTGIMLGLPPDQRGFPPPALSVESVGVATLGLQNVRLYLRLRLPEFHVQPLDAVS
jgi:hypothetical protein